MTRGGGPDFCESNTTRAPFSNRGLRGNSEGMGFPQSRTTTGISICDPIRYVAEVSCERRPGRDSRRDAGASRRTRDVCWQRSETRGIVWRAAVDCLLLRFDLRFAASGTSQSGRTTSRYRRGPFRSSRPGNRPRRIVEDIEGNAPVTPNAAVDILEPISLFVDDSLYERDAKRMRAVLGLYAHIQQRPLRSGEMES